MVWIWISSTRTPGSLNVAMADAAPGSNATRVIRDLLYVSLACQMRKDHAESSGATLLFVVSCFVQYPVYNHMQSLAPIDKLPSDTAHML